MKLNRTGNPLDRETRNKDNENWEIIESGFKDVGNDISRIDGRVDGFVEEVSNEALGKVVDNAKLNWKEPVDGFGDLPSSAQKGDTRMVRDTGKVYRFDGNNWVEIQQIDAGPVNELDSRLTSQLAENVMFEGQVDFVDMVRDRTSYSSMRVKKTDNPYESLNVFLINGDNHISYDFRKNANDDFWIFNTAYTGKLKTSEIYFESTSSRTGNWTELFGANRFTTEVGATFTVNIKGERIELQYYTDNRGGVFKIVINDDYNNPVIVSTYSESPRVTTTLIAEGLDPERTHKIVGEFIGDDPNNSPEGGTSRGWIRDSTGSPSNYTAIGGFVDNGTYLDNTMMLGFGSNKEFAFDFENDGERYWFPEHNNTGTAFANEPLKIIIDSKEVDLDSLDNEETIICESVQIVQNVRCELPNVSGKVADLIINYTITKDGIVSISGKLKITKNTKIKNGYTMMFPLIGDGLSELVTSIGNSKKSEGDGSIYFMEEDSERVLSFAGIGEDKQNLITAFSFDYPYKTLRLGGDGKGTGDRFYYYHQRSNYPKLYARIFNELEVSNGFEYTFSGRYAIGNIEGVYDFVR